MNIQVMLLLQATVFSMLVLSALIYMIIRITRHTKAKANPIPLVLLNKDNEKRESVKR